MDNSEESTIETPEVDNSQEEIEVESTEETETQEEEVDTVSERQKQQIEWSKKEALRLREIALEMAIDAAGKDANSLVKLHDKDPKLADAVSKHYGYSDYKDLHDTIIKKSETVEDDFETKYQKRKAQENHDDAISKISEKIEKLWDIKDEVQEYFDDLAEWKTLTYDKALKLYEMATIYAKKDKLKEDKLEETKRSAWSTWVSKSTPVKEPEQWFYVSNWKLIPLSSK